MLFVIKIIFALVIAAAIVRAVRNDYNADYRRTANNLWLALSAILVLAVLASAPA